MPQILLALELLKISEENHLYRVFNNSSFEQGGRFYGAPYQRLPKCLRKYLTINGEPTVELDYCAIHPTMLYHQRGLKAPELVYKYDKGDPLRDIAKLIILTAINAANEVEGLNALCNQVRQAPQLKETLLESDFSGSSLREKCRSFLFNFLEYHAPIRSSICSSAGVYLQYQDSQLASSILWHFTQKQIPILPIHDSFIVQAQFEDELRTVMGQVYFEKFNFSIGVDRS